MIFDFLMKFPEGFSSSYLQMSNKKKKPVTVWWRPHLELLLQGWRAEGEGRGCSEKSPGLE